MTACSKCAGSGWIRVTHVEGSPLHKPFDKLCDCRITTHPNATEDLEVKVHSETELLARGIDYWTARKKFAANQYIRWYKLTGENIDTLRESSMKYWSKVYDKADKASYFLNKLAQTRNARNAIHTETQPEFRLIQKSDISTPHIQRLRTQRRIFLPTEDGSDAATTFGTGD